MYVYFSWMIGIVSVIGSPYTMYHATIKNAFYRQTYDISTDKIILKSDSYFPSIFFYSMTLHLTLFHEFKSRITFYLKNKKIDDISSSSVPRL